MLNKSYYDYINDDDESVPKKLLSLIDNPFKRAIADYESSKARNYDYRYKNGGFNP